MSLMDTIKGARQEAEESGIPFEKPTFRKKDDGNEAAGASEGSSSQGFTRRSAAKAKPSRQAAAGVQVVRTSGGSKTSKPKGEQTKEERKAAWESIKASIIKFTAERYGVPVPEDQSDTDQVRTLRKRLEGSWGCPSWTRSLAWLTLANAMLTTVFKRIDVTLPSDAFVQHYMHRAAMPKAWRERFREMV